MFLCLRGGGRDGWFNKGRIKPPVENVLTAECARGREQAGAAADHLKFLPKRVVRRPCRMASDRAASNSGMQPAAQ